MANESSNEDMSRRRFLTRAIIVVGLVIGAAIGVPVVGYALSPAFKGEENEWVEIGPATRFSPSQPEKVEFTTYKKDGWVEEPSARSCWVLNKSNAEFVIYDPACTHLGCPYSWHAERNQFICPCHNGTFDIDGNVVSGPPPRPLRRFANKLEGGKLFIREEVINA